MTAVDYLPDVEVTEYVVNAAPSDAFDRHNWDVSVSYRGANRWAVCRHKECLSRSGEWSYERIPSNREEEWLTEHRFTEQEALDRAVEVAPYVLVNGFGVEHAWFRKLYDRLPTEEELPRIRRFSMDRKLPTEL